MNDNQIRQEILFDFYKALRNQTPIPRQDDNEKLKNINKKDYEFNYAYLSEHYLVDGSRHYTTDGVACYTPNGGITGAGMDVVERFIDGCVENIEKTKNTIISTSLSYMEKITELIVIWSNNSDLFQQALEFLSSLIG